MENTRYMKYTLKGELSVEDAHRQLGEAASTGVIVRIETGGGQTQVFVASRETGGTRAAGAGGGKSGAGGQKIKGVKAEEVTESDVTNI